MACKKGASESMQRDTMCAMGLVYTPAHNAIVRVGCGWCLVTREACQSVVYWDGWKRLVREVREVREAKEAREAKRATEK